MYAPHRPRERERERLVIWKIYIGNSVQDGLGMHYLRERETFEWADMWNTDTVIALSSLDYWGRGGGDGQNRKHFVFKCHTFCLWILAFLFCIPQVVLHFCRCNHYLARQKQCRLYVICLFKSVKMQSNQCAHFLILLFDLSLSIYLFPKKGSYLFFFFYPYFCFPPA